MKVNVCEFVVGRVHARRTAQKSPTLRRTPGRAVRLAPGANGLERVTLGEIAAELERDRERIFAEAAAQIEAHLEREAGATEH